MKRSPDIKARILTAALSAVARQAELAALLLELDASVAEKALDVFEDPVAASAWLLDEDAGHGRAPVEMVRTGSGRWEVMRVFAGIEHGIPQ